MTRPFSAQPGEALKLVLITLFPSSVPSAVAAVQKINFNLGTKSADEVLNRPTERPTDLAFSSPLSPLSASSSLDESKWAG